MFLKDHALHRAIALSLMDHPKPQSSSSKPHDYSRDSDDDELRFQQDLHRAMEASRADSTTPAEPTQPTTKAVVEQNTSSVSSTFQSGSSTPSSSFLSDRAQLERERLARLKRHRGEDHEDKPSSLPNKRQYLSTNLERTDERASTMPSISSSSSSSSNLEDKVKAKASNVKIPSVVDQVFWDGELRPTANLHSEPRQDKKPTFRLSEILGPVSCATRSALWLDQGTI